MKEIFVSYLITLFLMVLHKTYERKRIRKAWVEYYSEYQALKIKSPITIIDNRKSYYEKAKTT